MEENFPKLPPPSMFFFLRNRRGADYLSRLMWSTLRLLVVFLFPFAALVAQEQPADSPAPEATPTPESTPPPVDQPLAPDPTPEPPAEGAPEPAMDATADSAIPADVPAPPSEDVIPMEGQAQPPDAVTSAPLDTTDLAPMPDEAFIDPNALVPDELPPAAPAVAESAQEKARQVSIRYRTVRIEAEKDPKVLSLFQQADQAKTEEDRRAALREYYRLLFKKIVSIDKSLADRCAVVEEAYLRRLAQERLEPTIPLNPPPTPKPLD